MSAEPGIDLSDPGSIEATEYQMLVTHNEELQARVQELEETLFAHGAARPLPPVECPGYTCHHWKAGHCPEDPCDRRKP